METPWDAECAELYRLWKVETLEAQLQADPGDEAMQHQLKALNMASRAHALAKPGPAEQLFMFKMNQQMALARRAEARREADHQAEMARARRAEADAEMEQLKTRKDAESERLQQKVETLKKQPGEVEALQELSTHLTTFLQELGSYRREAGHQAE